MNKEYKQRVNILYARTFFTVETGKCSVTTSIELFAHDSLTANNDKETFHNNI